MTRPLAPGAALYECQVSHARPTPVRMTERRMSGSRPGYADYIARTSGFIPLPPRRPRRAA